MSQSWPPQQGWPPQQPDESPAYGRPDTGYGYPESGYGAPGPSSRGGGSWPPQQDGGGGWPPQQDSGWGSGAGGQWPPQPQYPQGPYQGGPYQQGPNSQGLYQQGPNSQGLYQPGGYVPGGYQQGPYSPDPYGQYANNPYGQPMGYGAPPAPAPRRSGNWLLPLVIVVLAILVVGGGVYTATHIPPKKTASTTQGTATTVAPGSVPPGFKQYTDDASHTQIALPQDWTTTGTVSGSNGLDAVDSDYKAAILAKSINVAVSDQRDLANVWDGFFTSAARDGTVTNRTGPANVTLAGETWQQEEADVSTHGIAFHLVGLVAGHASQTYLIAYSAPTSSFDSVNAQYFQPAIHSLAFTA